MLYRPDIDGLRAIAVCLVVFFHFGIPGFNGGFIGVDVFFVLSGFLIASVIFKELENGNFSFINFYFRRIRRLFPVFVVVMLFTTLVAYWLMLPHDFREFGQSLVSSTLYLSNFLFYWEAGYFDTASHLKPLLHTWSLSVEEQFYIIFPVLALLIYRFMRLYLLAIFFLLTLISLSAAQWHLEKDSSAVFFLYPFRAWEMFIGVCLATGKIIKIRSKSVNTLLSLIGLGLIVIPNILYSKSTPFPGLNALIPCLGTCLLIYTGMQSQGKIQGLLSYPGPVFIGKISYSLYLWHWPVFVLYMYDKQGSPEPFDIIIMSAITFIASVVSWKYIETPCRQGKLYISSKALPVFLSTVVTSALLVITGYWFHKTNGLPSRLEPQAAHFATVANDLFGDLPDSRSASNPVLPNISYCSINSPLAWTGDCPPMFNIEKDESVSSQAFDAECTKRNHGIKQLIDSDNRITSVVLVGRWSYYTNGTGIGVHSNNQIAVWPENEPRQLLTTPEEQSLVVINAFNKTIKYLHNKGLTVFVVEQPPEFTRFKARIVALGLIKGNLNGSLESYTSESYENVKLRQHTMQMAINSAVDAGFISVISTHNQFCNDNSCSALLDGIPAYFDNNHVSSTGAAKISSMFQPLMEHLDQRR